MRYRRFIPIGIVLFLVSFSVGGCFVIAEAEYGLAVSDYENKNYDRSISRLEKMLEEGKDSAQVRILLGWGLYKKNLYLRAKREFERSLRMDANDPNAFFAHEGLGWVLYKFGDYDRALVEFAKTLKINPGYFQIHNGLAWSYLGKRDYIRAEANFRKTLAEDSLNLDAQRGIGYVEFHRKNWERAIEFAKIALRQSEWDLLSRSLFGWSYFYLGNLEKAERIFKKTRNNSPAAPDPLLGLAWIAHRQDRVEEAKKLFREAIRLSAVHVAYPYLPIPNFRDLLKRKPEWIDLWRDYGWGLFHQRAFVLSEKEFRVLLSRYPDDSVGLEGWGYALYSLKRYREAIHPLERLVASNASLPSIREKISIPGAKGLHEVMSNETSTLAWSYYFSGNYGKALSLFRKVTRRHPDWVDPWSGLGWTLLKIGDRKESESAFRQSLKLRPGYPDADMGLKEHGKRSR